VANIALIVWVLSWNRTSHQTEHIKAGGEEDVVYIDAILVCSELYGCDGFDEFDPINASAAESAPLGDGPLFPIGRKRHRNGRLRASNVG